MTQFGTRVQKSVFECWLTEGNFRELRRRLDVILDTKHDSVRYYPLCADCRKIAKQTGEDLIESPQTFYIT